MQPVLGTCLDVSSYEAEYVVVPHEDSLVDLRLAEPARLLGSKEHLDTRGLHISAHTKKNRIMAVRNRDICRWLKSLPVF